MDIGARSTHPGTEGTGGTNGGSGGGGGTGGVRSSSGGTHGDAPDTTEPEPCDPIVGCRGNYTVELLTDTPTPDTGTPPITATDIAHITPNPPHLTIEPIPAAVTRLPANLIATATTHTRTGHLLGHPITVRFTPTTYTFDHGDGTTTTTPTGGTPWHTLHQLPHTPTPTSHTYTKPGTYTLTATVHYTAHVNTGTGWHPVTGTITATTRPHTIRVYTAHTALVQHTCHEDPHGKGC